MPSAPKEAVTDVLESNERKSSISEDTELQFKRPVPLPRKKSLGKSDTDEQMNMAPPPEVCFLFHSIFAISCAVKCHPTSMSQLVKKKL